MPTYHSSPVANLNTSQYTSKFTNFSHNLFATKIPDLPFLQSGRHLKTDIVNVVNNINPDYKNLINKPETATAMKVVSKHYSGADTYVTTADPAMLYVYTPLQREANEPALIKALVNYNPYAVSQLTVVEDTSTGYRYVIDGQHTAIRAYILGNPVEVRIIEVDSKKTDILRFMSSLFITLNTATPVSMTTKGISNIVQNPNSNHSTGFGIIAALNINTESVRMAKNGQWHHPRKMSISKILASLDAQALYDSLSFYQHIADPFYSSNEVKKFDSFLAGSLAILIYSLRTKGYGVDFDALERAIIGNATPHNSSFESILMTLKNKLRTSRSVFDAYSQEIKKGQWIIDHNDLSDFTGNCFTWKSVGLFDLYINEIPAKEKPIDVNGNVINFESVFEMQKTRKPKGKTVCPNYKAKQPKNILL